jgi:hypothetical protein
MRASEESAAHTVTDAVIVRGNLERDELVPGACHGMFIPEKFNGTEAGFRSLFDLSKIMGVLNSCSRSVKSFDPFTRTLLLQPQIRDCKT